MIENTTQFVDFLIKAKKATYASDGTLSTPSRPASKDLHFKERDYLYIDSYLGSFHFIGEEAVWKHDTPIWGMNYYGNILTADVPQGFSECLKGALLHPPVDAPYRGPARFVCENFEYHCQWQGTLENFTGTETILMDGREMYALSFHGGTLQG